MLQLTIRKANGYPTAPKSLQKQNELILVMKKLESDVNRITFNYEKKNNDLDDLKKSLLQKAFAGELTQTKVTA